MSEAKMTAHATRSHVTRVLLTLLVTGSVLAHPQGSPDSDAPTDRCSGSYEAGTCKSYLHKWFYNSTSGTCQTFVYGGCEGNSNRFDSRVQCLYECVGDGHTLPPYLVEDLDSNPEAEAEAEYERLKEAEKMAVTTAPWSRKPTEPPPPIPLSERGAELTFEETGHKKVFMFAKTNTFIQLDANRIPNFQLRLCREISFQFRTGLPHGLLVYHSVKNRPEGLDPYALYVIVENGQLKVVHVFGKHSTSLTVGQGLNRDEWHSVTVRIDVHGARLRATVDDEEAETKILGLDREANYGILTDLTSVVLVGGLSPEEKLHGVKYIIESFMGCIREMTLSAGKAASDLLPIQPLVATKHENVVEGCINKCKTVENLCFVGSKCVNHYDSLTCDCFGTRYEGEQCDVYTATILTLRGSSYLSYRVYDWKDRVKSSYNRMSLHFKTRYDDSALFYASGEPYQHHYIAAAIKNKTVHIEVDFGDGPLETSIGVDVSSNHWNNLTISHYSDVIQIYLNDESKLLELPGTHHHLYIDPEIYIGGGPDLANRKGLASTNNFAGGLKYVYFNDISIIYELKKSNPKVHYIGVLEPEIYDADVETIPITFPFPSSHIWWPNTHNVSLALTFDYKSSRPMATLASSEVMTDTGSGYWELRAVNEEIRFELVPDVMKNVTHLTTVKFDSKGTWHKVELNYSNDELKLTVDYKHKTANIFHLHFRLGHNISLASGLKTGTGLVGCMRDITVNGVEVEPRSVVRSRHAVGEVSLDNCMLVDPCSRPNTCEHSGKCSVKDDKVICDCKGTGYIGYSCHFAEFRKTCEELALLGYTKPDVYLIDIDGNGPFPPAHVKCEFQSFEESTKTVVEHNLPSQVDVRGSSESDFSFSIKYREFSAEMLQELISHSLNCSQHIKYDCYKAPLELHSATWFVSSGANDDIVDYIGNVKRGSCPCAVNRTCLNPSQSCNCDISEGKWHSDDGYYTTPESLGITEMVFLQQKDLGADAQGRITLGPLECVETNTQQYVVTFTSSQSYIEVPGWRKGDISFSFRTTGEKAILLYQPPIRPHHPSFMVALTSDFELTFNFTLNNGGTRELLIKSQRRLNGGEWQKIWIDYNEHHVRFMINTDYEMVDLLPDQEFGPFEGSMFIGGATEDLLRNSTVRQGLIGCFRGLVVNGEILDIYSYMSVHLSEIIKECKPSCDPNPCKNKATCKELWSTFQCVCQNPWAHVGTYCETNINTKGLTFIAPEAYVKRNYLGDVTDEEKLFLQHLMNENILINLRTYEANALVLYANDNFNNFVQIYLQAGRYVVFMFNVGGEIRNVTVDYPRLNSGTSVQIAIVRDEDETTVHVNDHKVSIAAPVQLLTAYSNKPWSNPEREVLAPQRPPAPPTEYFQTNIGGYDTENLIQVAGAPQLGGFVGCIRGLKIGDHLVDLPAQLQYTVKRAADGVKAGCQMKCDEIPCKNQGICIEDFLKAESSCNCEHTSYYGEFCATEKGADFGGESSLKRKYVLEGSVSQVKIQLAFSSHDQRQRRTVLLLLQTETSPGYYLLVALTGDGYLIFEENRQETAMGATIKDRHFLNGARHSVYYQRTNDNAVLLIDREEVPLTLVPVMSLTEGAVGEEAANQVQVGGFNSTDPRFIAYKSYSGCLSNVFVEVNSYVMKPLEEYMFFTKSGNEKVEVINAAGVRSAQCSDFDVAHKPQSGLTLNMSLGRDKAWVEDPPARVEYKSLYTKASTEEDGSFQIIFLILSGFFVMVIVLACCLVCRNYNSHRKRKLKEEDNAILWQKGQPVKYQDPVLNPNIQMTAYKPIPQHDLKPVNGSELKPIVKNDYQQLPMTDDKPLSNGNGKPVELLNNEPVLDPAGQEERLQEATPVEDLPRSMHNSIAEEDEDADNEDVEEGELLDIPTTEPGQDGGCAPQLFSSIPDVESNTRDSLRPVAKHSQRSLVPGATLSPVFLSNEQRTFSNPISYLGGPRLNSPNTTRASLESVLSLD